ncbi:MAG: integrin alpha, partial [Melioribacteraceae bacterium]
MLHKHNTIYIHLVLLLVLLFCLPILAQQQSVSTSNNSAAALGKAKQPDAPSAIAERFFNGMNAGDKFGTAVSSAGDVNGDGYGDVIVGADGNNGNTGKAYIFFGGNIINNMPDVTLTGEAFGDRFGYSVSTAGDVNGDGYSDVIVGAYVNGSFTGKSYLYFGSYTISGNITASNADVTMTGEATSNFFGYSVSSAGDVNGDGYSDVIVGAYGNTINTGKSYIYFGGSTMNPTANVTLTGEVTGDRFGISVSSTGD